MHTKIKTFPHFLEAQLRISSAFLEMMNFLCNPPRGYLQCKHSAFCWRCTQKCFEEVPTAPAAPRWEYFVLFPADPSVISVNICSEEQQTEFWKAGKTLFKMMVNIQGMFS